MESNSGSTAPSRIELLALQSPSGQPSDTDALIAAFLESVFIVPSATDPGKGSFEPVLTNVGGMTYMVVCDTFAATKNLGDLARFAVSLTGTDIVRGLTADHGVLVLTPRTRFAFDELLLNEIRSRQRD